MNLSKTTTNFLYNIAEQLQLLLTAVKGRDLFHVVRTHTATGTSVGKCYNLGASRHCAAVNSGGTICST
jgi:hypothetical protein